MPQVVERVRRDSVRSNAGEEFLVIERLFSEDEDNLSIGLANIHAVVPGIEANKERIAQAVRIFKERKVNMAVFPEFCLSGYFWEDETECREYMHGAVTENHLDWIDRNLRPLLDDNLKAVVFNNIRRGPEKNYLNSTYVLTETLDLLEEANLYNKVFLPGIEKVYTDPSREDRLVLDTHWGKFGFTTCYDLLFPELLEEYAKIDNVDAVVEVASWRAMARRDYPGMNVGTSTYYGDLWNMTLAAQAALHQIWFIACNAVGEHGITGARFWGGSGIWAPSGLNIIQASRFHDELVIIHNIDVKGQRRFEREENSYSADFESIYHALDSIRAFTRFDE